MLNDQINQRRNHHQLPMERALMNIKYVFDDNSFIPYLSHTRVRAHSLTYLNVDK